MDEPPPDDRCDACGVQAYVYTTLASGKSLSWCAHHADAFWVKLTEVSTTIVDLRHLIPK